MICLIINGNPWIYNLSHARWCDEWSIWCRQYRSITCLLPVITIGLLFGLAIDYELFLMTRVHEEYSKTGDNDHSIRVGIKESGPVIVAAALIMFSVFIAFIFQDDTAIKSMGLSLAFGVLFDAFIVRMTLIPALTKLFGNASWYLPKWLGVILPKIDVEGKALEEHHESSTSNYKHSEAPRYREFVDTQDVSYQHQNRSYATHSNNYNAYDDVDYEALYTEEVHLKRFILSDKNSMTLQLILIKPHTYTKI